MKQTYRAQQGFTLIELMIVVAIIGIFAAIALPAYQNYIVRGDAGGALNQASGSKTCVAELFQRTGGTTGAAAECDAFAAEDTSVADNGTITSTGPGERVRVTLTYAAGPPSVWTCTYTAAAGATIPTVNVPNCTQN